MFIDGLLAHSGGIGGYAGAVTTTRQKKEGNVWLGARSRFSNGCLVQLRGYVGKERPFQLIPSLSNGTVVVRGGKGLARKS